MLEYLIVFGVAGITAIFQLLTTKFPRTFTLIIAGGKTLVYFVLYGLIGVILFKVQQTFPDQFKIEFTSVWYLDAIIFGFVSKAFIEISFFSYTPPASSKPFPVGLKSIVYPIDNYLVEQIGIDSTLKMNDIIRPRL